MSAAASSVRITPASGEMLDRLAGKLSQAKAQVIEEALRLLEERIFWVEVQTAFADGQPAEIRTEQDLWDRTVNDGLATEPW